MIDFKTNITLTDDLYRNKTHTYILPVIKDYGSDFVDKFAANLKPIAYTIGDMSHDINYQDNNYLYVTCTMNTSVAYNRKVFNPEVYERFKYFLEWVKNYSFYVTEYIQGDISDNRYTFVFDMPKGYENLKRDFLNRKYSTMYSKEQIARLIDKTFKRGDIDYLSNVYRVLTKDPAYLTIFNQRLKDDGLLSKDADPITDDIELDYKPQIHQEVLNYNKEKDPYINE
jgi:hypothetical protein